MQSGGPKVDFLLVRCNMSVEKVTIPSVLMQYVGQKASMPLVLIQSGGSEFEFPFVLIQYAGQKAKIPFVFDIIWRSKAPAARVTALGGTHLYIYYPKVVGDIEYVIQKVAFLLFFDAICLSKGYNSFGFDKILRFRN